MYMSNGESFIKEGKYLIKCCKGYATGLCGGEKSRERCVLNYENCEIYKRIYEEPKEI